MLDIRLLRDTPDEVRARLAMRDAALGERIDEVLEIDKQRRQTETRLQQLQSERKALSKSVGRLRAAGEDSSDIENQVRALGVEMESLQAAASTFDSQQRDLLLRIPNMPHPEIPLGKNSADNVVLRHYREDARQLQGEDHLSIATRLHLLDFERAAKISGSGFACFTGQGARLQRALIAFMLDLHTKEHGYIEIAPPYLIRRDCMVGTGQLPKFEEDMYGLEEGSLFLAPTAEVPVTNLRRDELLSIEELPASYTAYTPCFRREAGATGRDNRGIIRLHQFDKVELVKICHPDAGPAELEKLTADAEKVLQLLELPYRVIELCAGDLGFSACRTYDIEVWSPGQQNWLEVSSCSHFGDYQARRMGLRFKDSDGKNRFCHTLNGSGTALPRLYVALLENHCQQDGTIRIPGPLQRYFGAESSSGY